MNYHFWADIYHIKQSQYQILNVLKICFLVLCRSSSNPFMAGNGNQHGLIWQVQKKAEKSAHLNSISDHIPCPHLCWDISGVNTNRSKVNNFLPLQRIVSTWSALQNEYAVSAWAVVERMGGIDAITELHGNGIHCFENVMSQLMRTYSVPMISSHMRTTISSAIAKRSWRRKR